jgi:hypothetical protein
MIFCRNHPFSDAARKVCAELFRRWRGPLRTRIDAFLTPVTVNQLSLPRAISLTRAHLSQLKPTVQLMGFLEVVFFFFF